MKPVAGRLLDVLKIIARVEFVEGHDLVYFNRRVTEVHFVLFMQFQTLDEFFVVFLLF